MGDEDDDKSLFRFWPRVYPGYRGERLSADPGKPVRRLGEGVRHPGEPRVGRQAQLEQARVGALHPRDGNQEGRMTAVTGYRGVAG